MAAGVVDTVWSLADLMEAALAEPAGEKPVPVPLAVPKPEGPTRELPGEGVGVGSASSGATMSPRHPPQRQQRRPLPPRSTAPRQRR